MSCLLLLADGVSFHMQGNLSLLAEDGSGGLPLGHIVAYKASHDLQLKFTQALRDSCSEADYVPVPDF